MTPRFFLATRRGSPEMSGIVVPDSGDRARVLQRAAELLAHLSAAKVTAEDVELLPYFPPEHDKFRFGPSAA